MVDKVAVIGGNFAGPTAALSLKQQLGQVVDVTVVSKADRFLFTPSLIWVPSGKRRVKDIVFPVEPTFDRSGVGFLHAEATSLESWSA